MNFPFFKRPLALSLPLFLVSALLFPFSSKGSQVLTLTENKRLEAAICPDSMNRIAVANDRITQIFGDDGTFESQNDENTGQVFLKPTAENGVKSLSLTFITEQGITQDLTLKPTAKSAATLIFKNTTTTPSISQKAGEGIREFSLSSHEANSFDADVQSSFPAEQTSVPQGHLLVLLRKAVLGQLTLQEGELTSTITSRPSPEGLQVSHHQSYASDPYSVYAFHVENTMKTPMEVQEKSFYQPGDLAISLHKRILPSGGKTLLYVVRLKEMASLEGGLHD